MAGAWTTWCRPRKSCAASARAIRSSRSGAGEIGVISSVTQAFCASCNRLRLSAEGSLYTCLFADHGHDLKWLLRSGGSDEEIVNEIAAVWRARGDRYSEIRTAETAAARKIEMSYIGG